MTGGKAAQVGPGDSRPGAFEQPGERHQDQEPEPAGLSKMHGFTVEPCRASSIDADVSGRAAGDQGVARRQRAVERGLGVGVEHGQVAHFSAGRRASACRKGGV